MLGGQGQKQSCSNEGGGAVLTVLPHLLDKWSRGLEASDLLTVTQAQQVAELEEACWGPLLLQTTYHLFYLPIAFWENSASVPLDLGGLLIYEGSLPSSG